MEKVKLTNKNGDIIERNVVDYENNIKIWTLRGWVLYKEKTQKAKKKPKK